MAAGVARGSVGPLGHRRLVRHEEVVHVPGHEVRGRGIAPYGVYDVLAVEIALLREECLVAVVVIVLPVAEVPGDPAVGPDRVFRCPHGHILDVSQSPSREGSRRLLYVVLRVVADAHGKELQELSAEVLVDGALVVVLIVEPDDHPGVPGQLDEERVESAHSKPAEHVDLVQQHAPLVSLRVARGEYAVPEEGDLLIQGRSRRDHPVDPVGSRARPVPRLVQVEVVPVDQVLRHGAAVSRLQELLDRRLVTLVHVLFELGPRRSESRPSQQVRHQFQIFVSHRMPSCSSCDDSFG